MQLAGFFFCNIDTASVDVSVLLVSELTLATSHKQKHEATLALFSAVNANGHQRLPETSSQSSKSPPAGQLLLNVTHATRTEPESLPWLHTDAGPPAHEKGGTNFNPAALTSEAVAGLTGTVYLGVLSRGKTESELMNFTDRPAD